MTQLNSKKIALLVGSALIIAVAYPALAFAQTTGVNFCRNINTYFADYNNIVQQKINNLNAKIANSQTIINNRRAEKDAQLAKERTLVDTSKITYYASLEAAATTNAEKAAVQTFETSVNNATATKRTAVDSATKTYRNGVDVLLAQKLPLIESAAPVFESSVNAIANSAKTECNQGMSPVTVFASSKVGLQAAISQFKAVVKYGGAINTQMAALISARNVAYQQANNNFSAAIQQALNALDVAFGV